MINLLLDNVVLASLLALIGLGGMFGGLLGYAAEKFKINSDPVIDTIDELLPQTQCGQCGFPGCRPYAQSIADGDAINKCPPGGQTTINAIAKLLDITAVPIAYIREDECIGCTKCIQACPVDAILGSAKLMHTVIEKECTGCDLCVDPCPVDCIDMLPVKTSIDTWYWPSPENIPPSTTSAYTEGHAS